ncbi:MAG: single-stranded-DNA-specific exonuclease RecJ [Syntrophomonadaceae bacterium]
MDQNKVWIVNRASDSQTRVWSKELGISPVLAGLLVKRGIDSVVEARRFLAGGWEDLDSPWTLSGMEPAAERLQRAAYSQEPVVVFGDYDVDGICSVVIMLNCLKALGCRADYYIPDRFQEGYGLNAGAVEELAAQGIKLLLSVDCGINSLDEVDLAVSRGMDVIVSDHHNPGSRLPDCAAVINPKLGSGPHSSQLCGAGVAFYLARALDLEQFAPELHEECLGLAALATVADIVPLLGDNRILVREGLKSLGKSQSAGIKALLAESGLKDTALDSWHLGFVLAPRLNAAGRLANARMGVELLTTSNRSRAEQLAAALGSLNQERKTIEDSILNEAAAMIDANCQADDPAIVLAAQDWHHGVLGITASRLCERFHKPVVMVGWEGRHGRGSARSIPGLNIFEALGANRDFLLRFGGHSMAAGLNIELEQFTPFKEALLAWVAHSYRENPELRDHVIEIDSDLEPASIDDTLVKELELLKPFGIGNPRPLFALRGIEMGKTRLMGKQNEHFKCRLQGHELECIAFNGSQYMDLNPSAYLLEMAGSLEINRFRGREQIQMRILDIKHSITGDGKEHQIDEPVYKMLVDMGQVLGEGGMVYLIFPTPRVLKRGRPWLQAYFPERRLIEIYARPDKTVRQVDVREASKETGCIILTTQAFFEFAQKRGWWSKAPLRLWRFGFSPERGTGDEKFISWGPKSAEWVGGNFKYSGEGHNLVYVNRPATLTAWTESVPGIVQEAGIKDDRERRAVQRSFFSGKGGLMISDGGCIRGLQKFWRAQQVWFADAPFSIMEASILLDYLDNSNNATGKVLFSAAALDANRSFLNSLYPPEAVIESVGGQLQNASVSELKGETAHLCRMYAEKIGRRMGNVEFTSALRILEELGLCQVQKKGSIIAIKLIERDILPGNLSDSSFYIEGQAEKAALTNFEEDVKSALDW